MSVHQFSPGREPGRCARCGCALAEAVHAGELPAVTEADSAGQVYRLSDGRAAGLPNPARDIYPAAAASGRAAVTEARLDRLDALSDWERTLLLAHLDGRAPGFVDEWFAGRKPRLPSATGNSLVSCAKAKIQLDG